MSDQNQNVNPETPNAPEAPKAETAVPAKKAAPKADPRLSRVVTLLAKENPKKPGSAARARFDLYAKKMSVGQALKAGVLAADLKWDERHGFIKITAK